MLMHEWSHIRDGAADSPWWSSIPSLALPSWSARS